MAKTVQVFILILVLHVLESALANKFSSLSLADECSLLFQFKESVSINKSASIYDSRAYPKVASWNLNGSDGAGNCCLGDGVECRLGHVIGLDLSSNFLYGPISSNNSLFNLIHLRTRNLANNDFRSSRIPSGIGRLSQIINLNLSNSFFSGEVPKQISHLGNLVSLDLTENYKLTLQGSDFQNLVQNTSETLRELGVFKTGNPKIRISEFRISEIFGYQISLSESVSEISDIRNSDI
ncbi:putative leucine-rich repeat domain superfamily [Helianthus annuus]|nr:putative leucine-rich repeat domain superfamily [Helianthus annuus]KAJ0868495.1 putative leucine-rich repeat domain superfamily [Helianthus annuus]